MNNHYQFLNEVSIAILTMAFNKDHDLHYNAVTSDDDHNTYPNTYGVSIKAQFDNSRSTSGGSTRRCCVDTARLLEQNGQHTLTSHRSVAVDPTLSPEDIEKRALIAARDITNAVKRYFVPNKDQRAVYKLAMVKKEVMVPRSDVIDLLTKGLMAITKSVNDSLTIHVVVHDDKPIAVTITYSMGRIDYLVVPADK